MIAVVSSWFAWSSSPWGPLSDGGGHARPTSSLRHPCFLHPPNRHRRRPSTAHPKRTRRRCVLSAPRSIAAPQPSSPRPKRPRQCLAELPSSVDGSRSDDLSRSWAGEGRKAETPKKSRTKINQGFKEANARHQASLKKPVQRDAKSAGRPGAQ